MDVKSSENITPLENYRIPQVEEIEIREDKLASLIGRSATEKLRKM